MTRPRLHPPDPDDGFSAVLTDPLSGLAVVFARSTLTDPATGEPMPGPAITCAIVGPAGPVGTPVAATPREVAGFALRLAALTDDVPAPRGPLTVPLHGWSASGSGGPPPAEHPPCPQCGLPVVDQGEGRVFHTDGTPACATAAA